MTATGNLLGTATSGLLAYQRALATTGHNVSNVNTPGYSRQRIELETRSPLTSGAGFIGNGVNISTVSRSYDQFITTQLRTTTAGSSELDAYYALSRQIDNMVADSQTGLMPALQDFFNAVNDVSNNPSSAASRQVMLSQANALTNRFQYMTDRLDDIQSSTNSAIRSSVAVINSLAQSVAQLNQQVYELQGVAAGQPPNDLLDQRDEALRQLAEHISINVVPQDNGMVNVFSGNGQSLVLGNQHATLATVQNEFDAEVLDVTFSLGNSAAVNITSNLTGGTLGGVLSFRDGLLTDTRNQLGRVAVGLAQAFNEQHRLGMDQNNALGGDFFTDLSAQTAVESRNNNIASDFVFTGAVTDIGALQASDYMVEYNAGTYTVTRMSDRVVVANSASPIIDLTATEGISITAAGTMINNGDSYIFRFTANAAQDMGLVVTSTAQIAAAAPLRSGAVATNAGSGAISPGDVGNTTGLPLGAPITLTFDPNALGAGIPGFNVVGGPGGTLAYNPATEFAGKTFTFAGFGGFTFKISGTPATGDQFTVQDNTGGVGDNRNALALAALQRNQVMINGASGPTASLFGAYSQMVSDVGARTHQADLDSRAQNTLLAQAQEAWSNKSGVNLDEEAANLIKFQQAYQAAAQLVNAASLVFDTLLGAVRR